MTAPTRVLFVNSGILGQNTFSKYVREAMALEPSIDPHHINLSEQLTIRERIMRRAMCSRVWRDGWLGVSNLDLARFRSEYHAGVQAARRMRRLFGTAPPDVVHFHRQATAYASVGLMGRIPGVVSIDCTQDIVLDAAQSSLERWSYQPNVRAEERIFAAAAAIISTSQWAADCVRRRYRKCDAPIHVMPSPVRLQLFAESWIAERAARAAAGGRPRVLFVGGDFHRKGGFDLLAAWRTGQFAGSADLEIVTDDPAAPIDLPDVRVIRGVASYSSEWSELWRRADIFVLPTRQEAFGLVFQEAAAAGLPRIGTRTSAVPELIADGTSGLLVAPGDPQSLVQALGTLVQSPELRNHFGRAAREQVLRDAHPDAYRRKLTWIIQDAAARRGTTSRVA